MAKNRGDDIQSESFNPHCWFCNTEELTDKEEGSVGLKLLKPNPTSGLYGEKIGTFHSRQRPMEMAKKRKTTRQSFKFRRRTDPPPIECLTFVLVFRKMLFDAFRPMLACILINSLFACFHCVAHDVNLCEARSDSNFQKIIALFFAVDFLVVMLVLHRKGNFSRRDSSALFTSAYPSYMDVNNVDPSFTGAARIDQQFIDANNVDSSITDAGNPNTTPFERSKNVDPSLSRTTFPGPSYERATTAAPPKTAAPKNPYDLGREFSFPKRPSVGVRKRICPPDPCPEKSAWIQASDSDVDLLSAEDIPMDEKIKTSTLATEEMKESVKEKSFKEPGTPTNIDEQLRRKRKREVNELRVAEEAFKSSLAMETVPIGINIIENNKEWKVSERKDKAVYLEQTMPDIELSPKEEGTLRKVHKRRKIVTSRRDGLENALIGDRAIGTKHDARTKDWQQESISTDRVKSEIAANEITSFDDIVPERGSTSLDVIEYESPPEGSVPFNVMESTRAARGITPFDENECEHAGNEDSVIASIRGLLYASVRGYGNRLIKIKKRIPVSMCVLITFVLALEMLGIRITFTRTNGWLQCIYNGINGLVPQLLIFLQTDLGKTFVAMILLATARLVFLHCLNETAAPSPSLMPPAMAKPKVGSRPKEQIVISYQESIPKEHWRYTADRNRRLESDVPKLTHYAGTKKQHVNVPELKQYKYRYSARISDGKKA